MTNEEIQAIKDRLARLAVHSSVMALEASKDLITLIAEVERLRAIISDMETAKVHIDATSAGNE